VFIAQDLRQKNIVEYLLYMWQVEDIIRAYDCSLSRIRKEYISRFDYSDEQLEDMTDWYGDLVTMMNQEGKRQSGHLQVNQVVLQQLSELHAQLLQSTKFPFYTSQYYKVLPFIVELRNRSGKDKNEIETCLDALYGTMMLRLQNKEITPNTSHAIQEITTLLGMLSDYYKKDKEEGLELE
jgi:flagellin-specific chaperone FliS